MNVSSCAKAVKQPKGGYLPVRSFESFAIADDEELYPEENVHSSIVGMVVDNLTRFKAGIDRKDVFMTSFQGGRSAEKAGIDGASERAIFHIMQITGDDDSSIVHACKAATYEVWSRTAYNGYGWKGPDDINPDKNTIHNIQMMLLRTEWWLDVFKPLVKTGFTFEPVEKATQESFYEMIISGEGSWGGYTPTVNSGDGDYLTQKTMWELKTSKEKPKSKDSLQLLMYWIMGQHSGQEIYKSVDSLGFFNPRRFEIYIIKTKNIDPAVIRTVERDVIKY